MGRTSRETWAKRIERWKDSGLTAAEFAAETGINAHSLSWWKWQLGRGAERPASPGPRRGRRRATAGAIAPLSFVEIATEPAPEPIEIVLPSGVRIRVSSAFDASTLGRVLDVLEKRA